jgi:hypothetical protein
MRLLMVKCLSYGLCYESWIKGRCHLYGDIDESFAWCELQMPERQEKPSHFEQESTILPIDPPENSLRGANESIVGNPRCRRRVR